MEPSSRLPRHEKALDSDPHNRTPDPPVADAAHPGDGSRLGRWFQFDRPALFGAIVFFTLSFGPSLLPHPWILQGLAAGVLAVTGFALVTAIEGMGRIFLSWRPKARSRRIWSAISTVAVVVWAPISLIEADRRGRTLAELSGISQSPVRDTALATLLAAIVFVILIALYRGIRWIARRITRLLSRWIPVVVARTVSTIVVVIAIALFSNEVVLQNTLRQVDATFALADTGTSPGVVQPISALKSGSSQSLIPWDSLGKKGRDFVATGPSQADIASFRGRPAMEPIRIYAGLNSSDSFADEAALAVADLERAGGLDRKYLVLATATGTGWVDQTAVDSFEFLHDGDTATISMQYSHLPSWLSFIVDRQRTIEATRALFSQVIAAVDARPAAQRPKLVLWGESLGAYGSQSTFDSISDVTRVADAVLWQGPPNSSSLWGEVTAHRNSGSYEYRPEYGDGSVVQFYNNESDFTAPATTPTPRIIFLQHAEDPIVWWTPDLMWQQPTWLREPRGPNVMASMDWYPFVTFWQVTEDIAVAMNAPAGHGHKYGASEVISAWTRLLPIDGWTSADHDRLVTIMDERQQARDKAGK